MSLHQIRPLLHQNVSIRFNQDASLFQKQRKTMVRTLKVATTSPLTIQKVSGTMLTEIKSQTMIIQILKRLKYLKTANVKDSYDLMNSPSKSNKTVSVIKKLSKVESLSIRDVLLKAHPFRLAMWLRYTKKIKKINCYIYELRSQIFPIIEKRSKRLFHWLNQIKVKEISLEGLVIRKNNLLFHSQKFPNSLERLSFSYNYKPISTELKPPMAPNNSLDGLTQLRTFGLHLTNLEPALLSVVNSIPNLLYLTALSLGTNTKSNDIIGHIIPFLDELQKCSSLKTVRISFSSPQERLGMIFDSLKRCSLSEFSFDGIPKDKVQRDELCAFLSTLDQVKSLRLRIPDTLDIFAVLKKLLKKPIRLQSFILECTGTTDPSNLEEIIDMLSDTAPFLRTLGIKVNIDQPSQIQFQKVIEFLHNLKAIEHLDFSQVNIPGEECFKEVANWCCSAKSLTSLKFGQIQDITATGTFVDSLKKILSKRGIEQFDCTILDTLGRNIYEDVEDSPYIDMKLVKQKNPFMEIYPVFRCIDIDIL